MDKKLTLTLEELNTIGYALKYVLTFAVESDAHRVENQNLLNKLENNFAHYLSSIDSGD